MSQCQTALIVDDDERITELVGAMLGPEGFDVRTARNGLQGYASYFRNPTDWVVTDVEMPELNGVEMARFIRSLNPDVKVVYMSGAVNDYRSLLIREAREFGAKILRKPFTCDNLVEQLSAGENNRTMTALILDEKVNLEVKQSESIAMPSALEDLPAPVSDNFKKFTEM